MDPFASILKIETNAAEAVNFVFCHLPASELAQMP
jgi:hypothetical protein